MGILSGLIGKFIPGPFYTDYQGDYPDDRPENTDSAQPESHWEPEKSEPAQIIEDKKASASS